MAADDLTVTPDYVFEEEIEHLTLISKFENGVEQRRNAWGTPRRRFLLSYKNRPKADYTTVSGLLNTKKGAYTSFLWTNPNDSVQYTVRFEKDSINFQNKAYGVYDFDFSILQVK